MSEQSKKHHEQREKEERERNKEHHSSSRKSSHKQQHAPRGGLLTFAIILVIIFNLLLAAAIHSLKGTLAPDAHIGLIVATWAFALASVVAGIAMWFWKKWGITLYIISSIAIVALTFLIFSLADVATWGMIMGGLLPVIIVLYIVKPHLGRFH
jgi:cation transport ATPase